MKIRRSLLVAVSGVAVLLLTACGGSSTPTAKSSGGGTLRIAMQSAPDSLNPVTAQSTYDLSVYGMMFQTLAWQSPDQKFHPLLASSWQVSPSGTVFTFHINPKARWTNGKPVTAQDVAFTVQLNTNPNIPAVNGNYMDILQGTNASGQNLNPSAPPTGVKIVNSSTFEFITKAPTTVYDVLYTIGVNVAIVPDQPPISTMSATEFTKTTYFNAPKVTDGPFELAKTSPNQYYIFKANQHFFMGKPKLAQVDVEIVPPTSLLAEFRSGAIDVTMGPGLADIPLTDWSTVSTLPNVKADPVPGNTVQFMAINTAKPYLKSAAVRRAIEMAIDRKVMVTQLLKGQGQVIQYPFNPAYQYFDKSLPPYPAYSAAAAKSILIQNHFPFSQPLTLLVPTGNAVRQESGPLIQQNLEAIGLKVNIQQYDFGTVISQVMKGKYDFVLMGTSGIDTPLLSPIFYECTAALNINSFCDPTMDKAYAQATSTNDPAKIQASYDVVQQQLEQQMPYVYLYYPNGLMAYNSAVNRYAIPNEYGLMGYGGQEPWLWNIATK